MPWIVLGSLEKGLALAGPSTGGWGGGEFVFCLFLLYRFWFSLTVVIVHRFGVWRAVLLIVMTIF